MSAAMMTIPGGRLEDADAEVEVEGGDLRRALTTSFTPRLMVLFLAAVWFCKTRGNDVSVLPGYLRGMCGAVVFKLFLRKHSKGQLREREDDWDE